MQKRENNLQRVRNVPFPLEIPLGPLLFTATLTPVLPLDLPAVLVTLWRTGVSVVNWGVDVKSVYDDDQCIYIMYIIM